MSWKCGYNKEINGRLIKDNTTPMTLFPIQQTLTQADLHYRLATLGYQKLNTYAVEEYNL